MPRRELLTEQQRLDFSAPATNERTMVRYYTLSADDLALIGVASENGKNRTLSPAQRSERPEFSCADLGAAAPQVVASQVNVFPAQRRQVL